MANIPILDEKQVDLLLADLEVLASGKPEIKKFFHEPDVIVDVAETVELILSDNGRTRSHQQTSFNRIVAVKIGFDRIVAEQREVVLGDRPPLQGQLEKSNGKIWQIGSQLPKKIQR